MTDQPLSTSDERPPVISPSLRTLAMPADTNPNGDIFGGWIISQMDLAGGTYAFHAARGRVATVAITGMQFLKPVYVGDEVSCYCQTEKIGTTSIAVNVETWVRRRTMQGEEKVTEGLFTFVAIDSEGKPRPIDISRSQEAADVRNGLGDGLGDDLGDDQGQQNQHKEHRSGESKL